MPDHEKLLGFIPNLWGSYEVETIIDGVLDHYINDEAGSIKDLWEKNQIGSNINLRNNLIGTIQKLNDMQPGEEIQKSKETILIPKNIDFFRMVFPQYKLHEDGPDKISTRIGVLDKLNHNDSLEAIVSGDSSSEKIDNAGKEEINRTLNSFKIHSSTDQMKHDLSNPAVTEGIKIFQKEYMENQWANKYSGTGKICKETLLAMNHALFEDWERALYFYYLDESGTEFYINDEDIESNIRSRKDIYAQENDSPSKYIGYWTPAIQGGIQHIAKIPFSITEDTNRKKICKAVSLNEGGDYSAVNTYDNAYLSIGLYQWSWEDLYDFLREARSLSANSALYNINFQEMFVNYGLNINNERETGKKCFIIDGIDYGLARSAPSQLKKLRFVYCFIKAADNEKFRKIQDKIALDRIDTARNVTVSDKGTKRVKDYITSRLGVTLVLDQHVNRKGHVKTTVRDSVNAVVEHLLKQKKDNIKLSKLQQRTSFNGCFNSDGSIQEAKRAELRTILEDQHNWGDEEEILIIEKYIAERNKTSMTDSQKRAADIRALQGTLDLSDKRDSYV